MNHNIQALGVALGCVLSLGSNAAQTCNGALASTAPDTRFEVVAGSNGQQILDRKTQLVWQRCLIGQVWNGTTCTGAATNLSWTAALQEARKYTGSISWRLANIKELQSLVEERCSDSALNERIFPVGNTQLWSSTPLAAPLVNDSNASTLETAGWVFNTSLGTTVPHGLVQSFAGWAVKSRN